jgi:AbrB family looped-hinge helix DNA binding protein
MRTIVSLNSQGRLTIPGAIRKELDLKTGDPVELEVTNGALIVRPVAVIPREDMWAYTPENRLRIERARQSPDVPNVTEEDLIAIIDADDPEAAVQDLIAARLNA